MERVKIIKYFNVDLKEKSVNNFTRRTVWKRRVNASRREEVRDDKTLALEDGRDHALN
jgi:hypothetical protein